MHSTNYKLPQTVLKNILGFHTITRFGTVSSFIGHGKQTRWDPVMLNDANNASNAYNANNGH